MMSTIFLVAVGGAFGSVLRYLTGLAVGFPYGTLTVNIIGSFLIGFLWIALSLRTETHPLLITGILGGFTTFSAFSLDTLRMIEDGRVLHAGLYVLCSVAISLFACAAGLWLARGIAQ
ncbi:MAG: fluoride efflux transporter CrcB [Rhodobacterales bacterium]|nr:fluoride efflux transporter CrcB [Rhodobacterales bacterium]